MKNDQFENIHTTLVKGAFLSFKNIVRNFLGNKLTTHYKYIVQNSVNNFKKINWHMQLNLRYLHFYIIFFADNMGAIRNEHGERFHHRISAMKCRCRSQWNAVMLADYS